MHYILQGSKFMYVNATRVAHTIFGETYFYGTYRVHYSCHTNAGNIFAFKLNVLLYPKNVTKPVYKIESTTPVIYV